MKKLLLLFLAVCLLCAMVGCGNTPAPTVPTVPTQSTTLATEETTPSTQETEDSGPVQQQPMFSVSLPVVTQTETAGDGTVLFHYIYQNMALIGPDPEVADAVIVDVLNTIDETASTAESVLNAAMSSYTAGSAWTPYLCRFTYEPTRIDRSVLSLYGEYITYSGTPHPEAAYISVTYDLVNGKAINLSDILTDTATGEILSRAVINHLNDNKETLFLYEGFEDTVNDRFRKSFDHDQAWNLTQTGLQFYFAPYEIAPYSSGVVVAEIPYNELTSVIKDDYFPAETDTATGTVIAETFNEKSLDKFTQFSEVVLRNNGDKILLYTDKSVQNVRLYTGSWSADGTAFTAEHAVFAANSLTPGDAIMIQDSFDTDLPLFYLTYESEGRTVETFISLDSETGVVTLTEY